VLSVDLLIRFLEALPIHAALLDTHLRYRWISGPLAELNQLPVAAHLGRQPGEVLPRVGRQIESAFAELERKGLPVMTAELAGRAGAEGAPVRRYRVHYFRMADPGGAPVAYGCVMENISDQALAQQAAHDSERIYRAIIAAAPDAILVADAMTGMLIDANEQASLLLGAPREEIIGKHQTWLHPPAEEAHYAAVFREHAARGASLEGGIEVLHRSGRRIPVEISSGRCILQGRTLNIGLFRDVTDRLRQEEDLRRANEELRELDQLKNSFLTNASHELRTPLVSIKGYLELLLHREVDRQKQADWLRVAQRNAERLEHIIDQLLKVSALEAGMWTSQVHIVCLSTLLGAAATTLAPRLAERGQTLQTDLPTDLPAVLGDGEQLTSVVLNLLENAIKFSPDGSQVCLSAQATPESVVIAVQDHGIGIPPHLHVRIFERFYQVDGSPTRAHGGFGVGLAVVAEIVRAHGGEVSVESAVGQGATFRVTLPRSSRPASDVGLRACSEDAIGARPERRLARRVLVIDDDADIRELMATTLVDEGCIPLLAADAEVALQLVEREQLDLVLVDLRLPSISGVELCGRLRRHPATANLPIYVFTARTLDSEIAAALEAGATGVLSKPFTFAELRRVLESP
jgi:PAS domain S-box-containing protein